MARFNFCVTRIESDLKEQSVFIKFSADVDPDSANEDSIYLLHRLEGGRNKAIAPVDIEVDGKTVQLKLKEWAAPNDQYVLIIQNNVCGIIDDPTYKLETMLLRNITFDSEVTSDIKILSPVDFAEVSSPLSICWKEEGETREKSYYLEIATENAFYNIIRKVFISKAQVEEYLRKEAETLEDMSDVEDSQISNAVRRKKLRERQENGIVTMEYSGLTEPGQYYLRIRAQKEENGDYGHWSKVCTFISKPASSEKPVSKPEPEITPEPQSDLPVIEDLTAGTGISGNAAAEKHIIPQYLEDLPEKFEIPLLQAVDISGATVVVRREAV